MLVKHHRTAQRVILELPTLGNDSRPRYQRGQGRTKRISGVRPSGRLTVRDWSQHLGFEDLEVGIMRIAVRHSEGYMNLEN